MFYFRTNFCRKTKQQQTCMTPPLIFFHNNAIFNKFINERKIILRVLI